MAELTVEVLPESTPDPSTLSNLQIRRNGVNLGANDVEVIDFIGGLVATRGSGAAAGVVTVTDSIPAVPQAADIPFPSGGNISAGNVYSAIVEVDSENRALSSSASSVASAAASVASSAASAASAAQVSANAAAASALTAQTVANAAATDAAAAVKTADLSGIGVSKGTNLIGSKRTGGVDSTAQLRLDGQLRNARGEYGLVPNSASVQTALMQTFLSDCAGDCGVINAGTYKVGALTVPAGTTVWAFGVTLDFSAAGNVAGLTCGAGVTIIGARLVGPGNSVYNDESRGIYCTGISNSPAAPTFVSGVRALYCKIEGFAGYGVREHYVTGGYIENCEIKDCGYTGVALLSCKRVAVMGCDIDGITPGTSGGDAYGIFFDRAEWGLDETSDPRASHIRVIGNHIRNVASAVGNNGQGIDTHAGADSVIEGNTIEDCEVGIAVTSSKIAGAAALGSRRITVAHNTIKGAKAGYGILLSGAITGGSTVVQYSEDVSLTGNVIEGHGIVGAPTVGAISMQATKRTTITGGSIARPAVHGINVGIENQGFSISGVSITDPHDPSVVTCAAIHINGNNNKGRVSDIVCSFEDGSLATNVAVNCVRVGAGLTGLDVELTGFTLIGVDATHLRYSEATSVGVNSSGLMRQSGQTTLVAGAQTVTFNKRFPAAPRSVQATVQGVARSVGVSNITDVGFDLIGTGTDVIRWEATT